MNRQDDSLLQTHSTLFIYCLLCLEQISRFMIIFKLIKMENLKYLSTEHTYVPDMILITTVNACGHDISGGKFGEGRINYYWRVSSVGNEAWNTHRKRKGPIIRYLGMDRVIAGQWVACAAGARMQVNGREWRRGVVELSFRERDASRQEFRALGLPRGRTRWNFVCWHNRWITVARWVMARRGARHARDHHLPRMRLANFSNSPLEPATTRNPAFAIRLWGFIRVSTWNSSEEWTAMYFYFSY